MSFEVKHRYNMYRIEAVSFFVSAFNSWKASKSSQFKYVCRCVFDNINTETRAEGNTARKYGE